MKIAICDDDVIMVSIVEEMLYNLCNLIGIEVEIDVYYNGSSLCQTMDQFIYYDLIYLDIEIPGKDGVNTGKYIRYNDSKVLIVYISSYEEYLMSLFEVEPFRFLKKPLNKKSFESIFWLAYKRILKNDYQFEFKFKRSIYKIPITRILYIESNGRLVNLIQEGGYIDKYYDKLDNVENMLKEKGVLFLRIHKSYLVNFSAIKKICYEELYLLDGTKLQISEGNQRKVREEYLDILRNKEA